MTTNLWYYRDQIVRLVDECLEVALVVCTSELHEFTVAKIFDIFTQLLPTAFVLNTGYWPFYNTIKKQSICVCSRYGLYCRHYKHDHHWIDLDVIPSDNSTVFSSKSGLLSLLDSGIEVLPVTGAPAGYTLNIKLTFQYKKIERGRPRRKKNENLNINQEQVFQVAIFCTFNIQREYYPSYNTVMFQPSPFFYETYGTYFPRLLHMRPNILANLPLHMNQKYYTVPMEHIPPFTLVLHRTNVPVYLWNRHIPVVFAHLDSPKGKRVACSKATQTDEQENNIEVWKYRELIGNLRPIWLESENTSCESLYGTQSMNVDVVFDPCTSPIKFQTADDSNDSVVKPDDFNMFTANPKVVLKRQRKKKAPPAETEPNYSILTLNPLEAAPAQRKPSVSYASILKSNKGLTSSAPTVFETYKDDPDFHWFESSFPGDRQSPAEGKNEKENLEIAEEFVREEMNKMKNEEKSLC